MGCCGGSNNRSNKKIKEWGDEESNKQMSLKQNPMLIIPGILILGFIVYKIIL